MPLNSHNPRPFKPGPLRFRRAWTTACLALVMGLAGPFLVGTSALTRDALWPIVRACVTNRELTGAAFPCLAVNLDQGEARGYAVLRPPVGRPDTILAPTRRSVGIEDPWLQDPAAPDLFAAAWRSRALASNGAAVADDRLALAINSRFARSQDQFHIHIGCLAPRYQLWMRTEAAATAPGSWRRLERRLGGAAVWALAIPSHDLSGVNPIRLAAAELPGAETREGLALMTIALAPARLADNSDGFVVFAWRHDPKGSDAQLTAEDFLAGRCP